MRKTMLGFFLALAMVSVLVAGCGQAKSTGSGSSAGQDYVIGAPEPMTGPAADTGTDMFHAMQMAVNQLNKEGGMLGHQIRLVEEDSACDSQTSENAAHKLVAMNVDAIIGEYCSSAALPVEPIYHSAGLPFLLPDANASTLTQQGFNDVFLINVGRKTQAKTAADFMVKTLGAKSVALIDDQSAIAVNLANLTQKDVVADGGTVIDRESVAPTRVDLTSLITRLKTKHPGAIYFTGYYTQGGLLIKQARQMGLTARIVLGDGCRDPKLIAIAGKDNAAGVYLTCTPGTGLLPNAKAWIAQYRKLYHTAPGPYDAYAYDAVMLLHHVITQIKSTDKAKVIAALHATNNYKGLTGTLQFSKSGLREHGTEVVMVVKDGKFVLAKE